MGNINTKSAFRRILQDIDSGKYNEQELIRAIAAYSRDKDNGRYDGCGFPYFVKNIQNWMHYARGQNLIHLICVGCSQKKVVKESELRDNALCACGGRRERTDQAQERAMAKHAKPPVSKLPTKQELIDAFGRFEKIGNDALCRMVIKQLENGAFRHVREEVGK